MLSLKTLLIVLREFLFLEPTIHGVNKPANDVGLLGGGVKTYKMHS